jgi:methylenetetrahydrofolate dehydrogenase (NADP+)/methenyltetrahydrofolate cyclohydrolase
MFLLEVILVGENPASKTYVGTKEKVAKEKCGFLTFNKKLDKDSTFDDVKKAITEFNDDNNVDGILLQLPLPDHLDTESLLDLIDPKKDVDGLHPKNQGLLQKGRAELIPCTPLGSLKLIDLAYYLLNTTTAVSLDNIEIDKIEKKDLSGINAVVVGRSILVGKPMATLLLDRNATVTVVHSRTKDIDTICSKADIIVAAVGREALVKDSWVKEGAIVIDVGINRNKDGKLCGDVDFQNVLPIASAITPVPGGVGPMTVAMLMLNTLNAYLKSSNK